MADATVLLMNVHETTTTDPGGVPFDIGTPLTLAGAKDATRFTFSSQMSIDPEIWTIVTILQSATLWEVRWARLTSATTMEPDTLIESKTGSKINWGSGTKDVVAGVPSIVLLQLIAPERQTSGFLARVAANAYEARTLQTSAPNGLLSWNNPNGVSGDPQNDDTVLGNSILYRTAGASDAQRTMSGELRLAYPSTRITGTVLNKHVIIGTAGVFGAALHEVAATAPVTYYWRQVEAGTDLRVVAAPDLADPGDDGKTLIVRGNLYALEDWRPRSDSDSQAVYTNLSVQVTVPSDGTWDIILHGSLKFAIGYSNMNSVNLYQNGSQVARFSNGGWHSGPLDIPVMWPKFGVTGGGTFTYTFPGTGDVIQGADNGSVEPHDLCVTAVRRA